MIYLVSPFQGWQPISRSLQEPEGALRVPTEPWVVF
jgi:hypothetical protein